MSQECNARHTELPRSARPFTLMAKPAGPRCNLRCEYCFYLEKEQYFPEKGKQQMSDAVLDAYIRQYIAATDSQEVVFAWQGGEPTLMGLEFFKKAVQLQHRYKNGKTITNSIQTNGVLLTDAWCSFLAEHQFLVGLSLDGPKEIHDRYRKDRNGRPTFSNVMQTLDRLQKHQVEFNVLACINRCSSQKPKEVYYFLKNAGVRFIQFIPVVELLADGNWTSTAGHIACPPADASPPSVTPWSVDSVEYGTFLIGVFDEWVRQDVGRLFVMNFEWTLASWMGVPCSSCTHAPDCGQALILEHNGDIYCCDHFMYPDYRLGNILTDDLAALSGSEKQRCFGESKQRTLPAVCRHCEMLFACHGGCLKHRFVCSSAGEAGLNYLCPGTKRYLQHVEKTMIQMAESIRRVND